MNRSDHEWTQDQLAAHVADGLSAEERVRIERHLAECSICRSEAEELREFDRSVGELFAPARAKVGLEERVLARLRSVSASKKRPLILKAGLGIAAALTLGLIGYLFEHQFVPREEPLVMDGRREPTRTAGGERSIGADHPSAMTWASDPFDQNGKLELASVDRTDRRWNGTHTHFRPSDVFGKSTTPDAQSFRQSEEFKKSDQESDRKIVRTGTMEIEIDSFDSSVERIAKIVAEENGKIATVNSTKLANGKTKGTMVVRVAPERLGTLVLKLRGLGDLKSQSIGSEDITKQYTDFESRLRAARTMEERLLRIIKEGKGDIKDLLQAEKELGEWRTKIEALEGEIRYFANLVAQSTLTISLFEREILSPPGVIESEQVQMGVESEDVEKAHRAGLEAIAEAKGRVTKSELKRHAAGQLAAVLEFEVAPEAAGPLRDRLKQLGTVSRLEVTLVQRSEPGSGRPTSVKRADTRFFLSLYNLANIAPRETVSIQLVARDVADGYRALREAVEKARGRVNGAQLNETDRLNTTATIDFEIPRDQEAGILAAMNAIGGVVSRSSSRIPPSENTVDSKIRVLTAVMDAGKVPPRETLSMEIEVAEVEKAIAILRSLSDEFKGRVVDSHLSREKNGRVTGKIVLDLPLSSSAVAADRIAAMGSVRVAEAAKNVSVPDGTFAVARLTLTVSNSERIVPSDAGFWFQMKKGLATSFVAATWSVNLIVIGICVVLPWALVLWGGTKIYRRFRKKPA